MLVSFLAKHINSASGSISKEIELVADISYCCNNLLVNAIIIGEEPLKYWVEERIKNEVFDFISSHMPIAEYCSHSKRYSSEIIPIGLRFEPKVVYHIFTDGQDDWMEDYEDAKKVYVGMLRENRSCARLYREEQDEDGNIITEDCIRSFGHFPY